MEKEEINMKEKLFYYVVIPVIALAAVIGFVVLASFSAENSAIGKEESIASATIMIIEYKFFYKNCISQQNSNR